MADFATNFLAGHMGARNQMRDDQQQANQNALMPLRREAMELDIAGRRQGMAFDAERMTMLRRQAAQATAEAIRTAEDAASAQADIEQGRRLITAVSAGGPGADMAWREIAAGLGNPDLELNPETFALAGTMFDGLEDGFLSAASNARFGAPVEQPKPTSAMQEYQFAVDQQGYDGTFADWKAGNSPQTNVNVNTAGQPDQYLYGSDAGLPAGWRLDRSTGEASQIPGGPAALEAENAEAKTGLVNEQTSRSGSIVLEDIGRVRDMLTGGRRQPVTGTGGAVAARVPGTEAADARALTETIKANIGFDRLQQMRDSSPTGGALGQVTERELATLQAVLGNLEFSQSKDQLIENLNRLEEVYTGILNKAAAYPNAAEFGFDGTAPANGGGDAQGSDIPTWNPRTRQWE